MRVEATLFTHPGRALEPDSLCQIKDACRVPSVCQVLATPDIPVGSRVAIGCVVATEEVLIRAAVGYIINCGMRVMATGLSAAGANIQALARAMRRDIDPLIEAVVGAGLARVVAKRRPLAVLKR